MLLTRLSGHSLFEATHFIQQNQISKEWEHTGISQGHCLRPLPKRLKELLKAGTANPQIYTDLASCIENEMVDVYDEYTGETSKIVLEETVNYECLGPLQESLGVSRYDAFLVKRTLNGSNDSMTEAKLIAGFSDVNIMKDFNKRFNYGLSFEDDLAGFLAKILLVLDG